MSKEYQEHGFTQHNAEIGDWYNQTLEQIATEVAMGGLPVHPDLNAKAAEQFVRQEFVFTRDGEEVSRADLFGE